MNAPITRTPNVFIGFDRLFKQMESAFNGVQDFPHHNIVEVEPDRYSLEMAVAGYGRGQLHVEVCDNVITVKGEKRDGPDAKHYLVRGIAGKQFTKRFALNADMKVTGAELSDGMLTISLHRDTPLDAEVQVFEL
jgi:molecular chaperone IbpA